MSAVASPGISGPSFALLKREVVRFLRQRNRIIGALGTPLVFWFLIGSGIGSSFRAPISGGASVGFLAYFFPGTIVMILLFTAIFSTISIIEDRREGFLQGVMVSPAPRSAIVLGKLLGGTLLATGQGLLLAAAAPLLGFPIGAGAALYVVALMALSSFALTGLGFLIAWRMDSTQGFHAVMNLFLMPLWFLSGALFPPDGAPAWIRFVMQANPLTYTVTGLHDAFFGGTTRALSFAGPAVSMAVTAAFAAVMFAAALRTVAVRREA